VSNIQSIIRADIKQEKEGVFTLERGKLKIRLENAATGIKAFAVPLVLLKKGWLRKNTIFIIDEPEVHLHPIWQVRYAEILTMLVKRGVHVIATTHSPYVVKSIIKFSHEYGIRKNTVFYITKRIEDGAKIENADERLNEIFELFSRPMREVF
jgi:predicted ATPase